MSQPKNKTQDNPQGISDLELRRQTEERYAGLENRHFVDGNLTVRATFDVSTFNREARTVEITFATENPVRRYTWDGPVEEVLSFDTSAVRLARMNAGASVLDNHQSWGSVLTSVGVVERAWIEKREGRAVIRFAKDEEASKIMDRVEDKILRNISVGYHVYSYEKTENDNGPDVWRAIDWEPFEASFVLIPADFTAQVRGQNGSQGNNHINSQKKRNNVENENPQTPETPVAPATPPPAAPPPSAPADVTEEQRNAIALAERNRASAITTSVRTAGLPENVAADLIQRGLSVPDAAAEILVRMAANVPPANPSIPTASVTGPGEVENRRSGMAAALTLRYDSTIKLSEAEVTHARQYRGLGLRDMARQVLLDANVDVRGLTAMEIAGRAFTHSTSDFPVILESVIHQTLLASYMSIEDTWNRFCSVGSVSDFREWKRKRMGAIANLPVVPENAEYTSGSIPDGESNGISVVTYGQLFGISRQMIVNDDLNAFLRLPTDLARAAARTIESKVYALLLSNPVMADGIALFHASHGNLVGSGSGGVVTVATVDAIRVLMGLQKDPNGQDYLGIRPNVLLTSLAQGGAARVVNEAQYDVDSTKFQVPNKVRGLFREVVDTPRLSGNGWYAFANPAEEPVLEVAFLDGVRTPRLESRMGWTVDGTEWKIGLDFGVAAVGYRGAAFNFGS